MTNKNYQLQNLKIFISGPMTGLPNYNFDHFNEVAKKLDDHKIFNINPVKICKRYKQEQVVKYKEVFDAMVAEQQKAERELCNAILLLDGWEASGGVRLELKTAIDLNFTIILEKDLDKLLDISDEMK